MPLLFLILILSFNYINLQANDDKFKCKKEDVNREIEIGDEVTLCIHSKELNQKIAYKLKVDKYSIITIKGGFEKLIPNMPDEDSKSKETDSIRLRNLIYDSNVEDKRDNLGEKGENKDKENNEETLFDDNENNDDSRLLTLEEEKKEEEEEENEKEGEGEGEEDEKGEEEEEKDENVAKVIAQIGDKMTQYPSVSVIFIIFIYFIFRYIVKKMKQQKKYLLYLVLLLK
jgi:preprotein translocase subunit YajC